MKQSLKQSKFKPQKSKGQNFLTGTAIPGKIVKLSGIDDTCGVLEIGPGFGALTSVLAKTAAHVTAVELDTRLIPELQNKFGAHSNITIIHGDILKTDIKKLTAETMPGLTLYVCANLPYNITTPVITKLIEAGIFKAIVIMVQKEVAQRICALPGTPEYGAFTLFINYNAKSEILFDVPPECFNPRPKVTSSVIKLTPYDNKRLSKERELLLFRTIRAAFNQRRKTLVNALHSHMGRTHSKETIINAVEKCGLNTGIRGETLGLDEYIGLIDEL